MEGKVRLIEPRYRLPIYRALKASGFMPMAETEHDHARQAEPEPEPEEKPKPKESLADLMAKWNQAHEKVNAGGGDNEPRMTPVEDDED